MATIIKLPKFGLTMEEATINEWLVGVGERVDQGAVIATIESEKVEIELPSPASGILAQHLVAAGQTVAVGSQLAVLVADAVELGAYEAR